MSSLDSAGKTNFVRQCGAAPGDIILFGVGPVTSVNKTLDRLRLFVAHDMDLIDHVSFSIGQSLFFFFHLMPVHQIYAVSCFYIVQALDSMGDRFPNV